MLTREEKLEWVGRTYQQEICSLDGKPASLYGADLDFCVVARKDGRGSIVVSWDRAILHIQERGGAFLHNDAQEDLRQIAEGRKEVPNQQHVTIRHKPASRPKR